MAYFWSFTFKSDADSTVDDLEKAGLTPQFEDQTSAEMWLGDYYFDLEEYGVSEVCLMKDSETVMGPMSLSE